MKKIEVVAKTVDAAIEKGLAELGITKEQAEIAVLSEGGFLKQSKVLVSQKRTEGEKAVDFIEGLLKKMKIVCVTELVENESQAEIELIGTDTSALIGHRGEVLDALQHLVSVVANKGKETFKRVLIDTEGYREKRTAALEQLAKNLENKVIKTGRLVKLEPMNAFERRIIHSALQESNKVTTASEGVAPNRYVVISLKKTGSASTSQAGSKSHKFVYHSNKKSR